MPKTGRPKTGTGHRDDALLDMLELRGELTAFVRLLQEHYRVERDAITAMDVHLRDASLSCGIC